MSKAVIVLADGFEEIEAVTPIDLLRRGGVTVTVAGLTSQTATSKRGLVVMCDTLLASVPEDEDVVILPGGMPGAQHLSESAALVKRIAAAFARGSQVAAICAAPAVVLGKHGFLKGRRFTGFPGTESQVSNAVFLEQAVVVDDRLITSRGAGTASDFALTILAALESPQVARKVAREVLLPEPRLDHLGQTN